MHPAKTSGNIIFRSRVNEVLVNSQSVKCGLDYSSLSYTQLCAVYHTSPFGCKLGLPESLNCLIAGAVHLHNHAPTAVSKSPLQTEHVLKLGDMNINWGRASRYWPLR